MTATLEDALVGTTLADRYRIDCVVGRGGFGVVFAGHHIALDVPVALKILDVAQTDAASRRRRIESLVAEAKTLAQLRHPHIARVLDSSTRAADETLPELFYLVLEWCEGPTLSEVLASRPPLDRVAAWRLFEPIVEAVAHAHEHGVVHRDLKPDNIMVVDGSPRVLDFGIAKVMNREAADAEMEASDIAQTRSDQRAFTPAYAAPEQVSGLRTGPWTDVHALGLILTELLVGRRAYHSTDAASLMREVLADERPTPLAHGLDAGPWEAVIAKALHLSPSKRHDSARELARDLARSLDAMSSDTALDLALGETAVAPGTPRVDPQSVPPTETLEPATASPRARRRPRRAVVAAVTVVASISGAVWLLARPSPTAEPPQVSTAPVPTASPELPVPETHPVDDFSEVLLKRRLEAEGWIVVGRDEQHGLNSSLLRINAERNGDKAFVSVQRWSRSQELLHTIESLGAAPGVVTRKQSTLIYVEVVGDPASTRHLAEHLAAGAEPPLAPPSPIPDSRWERIDVPTRADLNSIHRADDGTLFVAGNHGVVLRMAGGTWAREDTGLMRDLHAIWGRTTEIFAVGDQGTIVRREPGGRWEPEEIDLDEDLIAVSGNAERTVAVSFSNLFERQNGRWRLYGNPGNHLGGFAAVVGDPEGMTVIDTKAGPVGVHRSTGPGRWVKQPGWPTSHGAPWPFVRTPSQTIVDAGVVWANHANSRGWRPHAFARSGGHLVMVGNAGIILSLDASMIVTEEPSGSEEDLNDVLRAPDGTFYAVGTRGIVLRRRP